METRPEYIRPAGRAARPPPAPAAPAASARPGVPAWAWAVIALLGAALVGALSVWLPGLVASLTGAEPKAYWYLSRASALVGFGLLWVSMASGLLISNKLARVWPGAFTAFDLHQFTSLLGLGFGVVHALLLLGDQYIGFTLVQVLVPFAQPAYRPLWVGLGQIALYLSLLVSVTFYLRRQLGPRAWRVIHFLSYGAFGMTLLHGILAGTDSTNLWLGELYWFAGGSLLLLTFYRLVHRQLAAAGW